MHSVRNIIPIFPYPQERVKEHRGGKGVGRKKIFHLKLCTGKKLNTDETAGRGDKGTNSCIMVKVFK